MTATTLTNETLALGDYRIRRYNILTTDHWVYSVEEPDGGSYGDHSSLFTIEGRRYGSMASRRLPAGLAALKGEERYRAYDLWRQSLLASCYDLILQAFPEAAAGTRSFNGDIDLTVKGSNPRR